MRAACALALLAAACGESASPRADPDIPECRGRWTTLAHLDDIIEAFTFGAMPDGGFLVHGETAKSGPAVVVLNADGSKRWMWTPGNSARGDFLYTVAPSSDGGVIAVVDQREQPEQLVRLTAAGSVAWEQPLPDDVYAKAIVPLPDGTTALAGGGKTTPWVGQFDAEGRLAWSATLPLEEAEFEWAGPAGDGAVALGGWTLDDRSGATTWFTALADPGVGFRWTSDPIAEDDVAVVTAVLGDRDGGVIVAGGRHSTRGARLVLPAAVGFDRRGARAWESGLPAFPGAAGGVIEGLALAPDGLFVCGLHCTEDEACTGFLTRLAGHDRVVWTAELSVGPNTDVHAVVPRAHDVVALAGACPDCGSDVIGAESLRLVAYDPDAPCRE